MTIMAYHNNQGQAEEDIFKPKHSPESSQQIGLLLCAMCSLQLLLPFSANMSQKFEYSYTVYQWFSFDIINKNALTTLSPRMPWVQVNGHPFYRANQVEYKNDNFRKSYLIPKAGLKA